MSNLHTDWEQRQREAMALFADAQRQAVLDAIPARYRGGLATLAELSPQHADACRVIERWTDDFERGATDRGHYISGPTGTGKSGLAYALHRAMLERKHKSVLWYVPDFFEAMKRAFRNPDNGVGVDEITDEATMADLLILDDLAAELGTDWSVKTLSLVIDRRYRDCRPVAITSNLTGAKLLEAMPSVEGQRIVSRLCEMVTPLRLDGTDLRRA